MRKLLLALSFICIFNSLKAQMKCDSLLGDWFFTRWHTDQFFFDIEDKSATLNYKFQQYKKANHVSLIPSADSLNMIKEMEEVIKGIKENGLMKFTLNKNYTFDWTGTVNDPNIHFKGTYKCSGDTLSISADRKEGEPDQTLNLKIIVLKGKYLSLRFPDEETSRITNSIFTFKKK
jgi:hypothetical protein